MEWEHTRCVLLTFWFWIKVISEREPSLEEFLRHRFLGFSSVNILEQQFSAKLLVSGELVGTCHGGSCQIPPGVVSKAQAMNQWPCILEGKTMKRHRGKIQRKFWVALEGTQG